MTAQRPIFSSSQRQSVTHIFIGIDFGTSYTKVSYSYASASVPQIHTIDWGNGDFFKQTILYIQNDRLYFEKPIGECLEVKYFKYSLIEEKLKNNSVPTKKSFEEMCCVYFLAHILKQTLEQIKSSLKIENLDSIKTYVNMGVPLENFYKDSNKKTKGLYQDILENAVTLAGGSKVKVELPQNQVLISNLDDVYSELSCKKAELNWHANVYPELAAEILLYHQSKFVPDDVYAVIDVGGGTVDMALFQKETSSRTKEAYKYCIGQKIVPYGIEILNLHKSTELERKLQEEFCKILVETKKSGWINQEKFENLPVFFLGGGAGELYYQTLIKDTTTRLKSALVFLSFKYDIMKFINSEETLLQKNQRLIISQMLARPTDDIGDVKGFPDFFTNPPPPINPNGSNDEDLMHELAKESGWECD